MRRHPAVVRRAANRLAVGLAIAAGAAGVAARGASPPRVNEAVDRGKAFLYARQHNGNWEVVGSRKPDLKPPNNPSGLQYGGMTALATFALLSSGESPQDAHVKAAVEWLKHADMRGTYAISLRAQVWGLLPPDPTVKRAMERDRELLLDGIRSKLAGGEAKANGFFGYGQGMPDAQYDHSVSQFGVLGLWSLEQAGLEVETKVWRDMDKAWRGQRQKDGAWCYLDAPFDEKAEGAKGQPTGIGGELLSMTAAGVATLFITQDYANIAARCDGNIKDPDIAAGLQWVATHFDDVDHNEWSRTWEYYTLFGIARIGLASGFKYIGPTDWFGWGADRLLGKQDQAGSWGGGVEMNFSNDPKDEASVDQGVYDTSFALLFLARGRAPVLFNKLEYNLLSGKKAAAGNWDQRPRDVANLTRYVGRQAETPLNWQIVDLQERPVDLLDAPILYVAGNQPLKLSPGDVAKLKDYVDRGGLILGHADCANAAFADGFRKLGSALFPGQTFHPLPADHPIYGESFKRAAMVPPPAVEVLDNGVRVQMLLLPTGDPARVWQTQEFPGIKRYPAGQLMMDLYLYTTESEPLPTKGETYLVRRRADVQVDRTVKVARLRYAGNWDPEPAGWDRLANIVHNGQRVDLDVRPVELGAGKLTKDFALADLTGTAAVTFTAAQLKELSDYVAGGGTLLVDAAGGKEAFAAAAQQVVAKAFPAAPVPLPVVPVDAPVYKVGEPLGPVVYRRFARQVLGKLDAPRVRGFDVGGRTAVFLSTEDLAEGLVGQQVDGIVGYAPPTAVSIAEHVVLYAGK